MWADGDKVLGKQRTHLFKTFSPLFVCFTHERSYEIGFHDSDSDAEISLHFIFITLLGDGSCFAHFD